MTALRARFMRGVRPLARRPGPRGSVVHGLRPLARDRRGSVLIQIGIALPVLLGLAGLGLDVAIWQFERRDMQTAVDAAALAAAHALSAGATQAEMEDAANESFADSNFPLEASDVFELHSPPLSGSNAGDDDAVALVLTRPADMYLAGVVSGPVDISVRAVSGAVVVGEHCIVALDEEQDAALEFTGTADADIDCGVASNSRSDRAIHVGGNAVLRADPAQAFGDIFVEGSATLDTDRPPQPHSPRVADPFGPDGRDLQLPLMGSCDPAPAFSGSGTITVDPGHYCGDFLMENKTVHFNPGTYIIEDGDFRIKANSVVTGDDVTFILTGSTPSDVGVLEITSNSDVELTAPTTGDYAGILFYEDQNAASLDGSGDPYKHEVVGGADTTLNGALYSAKREIRYSGGATGSGKCLQMVARKVTVTGSTVIDNDPSTCAGLGLDQINQTRIRLLE